METKEGVPFDDLPGEMQQSVQTLFALSPDLNLQVDWSSVSIRLNRPTDSNNDSLMIQTWQAPGVYGRSWGLSLPRQ
jgi:hypothetical protein